MYSLKVNMQKSSKLMNHSNHILSTHRREPMASSPVTMNLKLTPNLGVERSPTVRETPVQSQVESYQRLKKCI